jgi:hypothetical protein
MEATAAACRLGCQAAPSCVTLRRGLAAHIRSQLRDFAPIDCYWTPTATRCCSGCGDAEETSHHRAVMWNNLASNGFRRCEATTAGRCRCARKAMRCRTDYVDRYVVCSGTVRRMNMANDLRSGTASLVQAW